MPSCIARLSGGSARCIEAPAGPQMRSRPGSWPRRWWLSGPTAAEGALFTPPVAAAFRQFAAKAARAPGCDPGELRSGAWVVRQVNSPATGTTPVNPCIANALPALPDELEYRSAGTVLVLVDSHANLIVDILPALLAGSDLRH